MKILSKKEARAFLSTLTRNELRDHAFGDREIWWKDEHGKVIVEGYSGPADAYLGNSEFSFEGRDALDLMECGKSGVIERND